MTKTNSKVVKMPRYFTITADKTKVDIISDKGFEFTERELESYAVEKYEDYNSVYCFNTAIFKTLAINEEFNNKRQAVIKGTEVKEVTKTIGKKKRKAIVKEDFILTMDMVDIEEKTLKDNTAGTLFTLPFDFKAFRTENDYDKAIEELMANLNGKEKKLSNKSKNKREKNSKQIEKSDDAKKEVDAVK